MSKYRSLEDQAVDRWVQACLSEQREALLQEPVPEALLRLLRDDTQS